ncbi:citrate (pro-3s)-lyase ligase [Vibrio anguillarum]|nr:[citrate (pro-3S)-lyase] ligase [Vibrio anguillarum]ARV25610.1 [citrate (pro-3S)-lyase] ligase [Vibrio anguillarum]UJQ40304.1 [citrate (pro-3S)-lyase] ligase [Vibrio anguillarum]CDQ50097.1 citrate (pro-3s)-lyase ligase [Vibrio anguillarum]STY57983.1 [Citrate [pro-3S]-lyase] ligase [Vibrio anguillarum]
MEPVSLFLQKMGLGVDADVELFVIAYYNQSIVGCGGLAGNTLKSVAVDTQHQGQGLSTTLLSELVTLAYDLGRYNLFIYTKPENYAMFHSAGFYLLTAVKGRVILLENSKSRLTDYCHQLSKLKQPGNHIGSIVMNANPFTRGHRYLIEQAAQQCDWVHFFVVKEDRSFFSYQDRLAMIRSGVKDLKNVIIHEGSDYIISRATFPSYFLKDEGVTNYCHTAVDLQLFRNYIAPALGITRRYVGTEPICAVTRFYNQQMLQWLTTPTLDSAPIALIELPRTEKANTPISASLVRNLLFDNQWDMVAQLVPETTLNYLKPLFSLDTSVYQVKRRTMAMKDRGNIAIQC